MEKVVKEIDAKLPPLLPDQYAYPIATLESSLPYMRDCIRENFRATPVFTMPLARRVMAPDQPNRAYDIIEKKFRKDGKGNATGYGLKIFP